MNAVEIKNYFDSFDKQMPLRKLFLIFGILPTAVFFPLDYFFNPSVNPILKNSPILIGFGAFAGIAMFLVLSIGGLYFVRGAIELYLAYGRFNARSMLADDQAPHLFSRRTAKYLFEQLRIRFEPIFEEIKSWVKYEISESKKEVISEVQKVRDEVSQTRKEDMFVIQQQWKMIQTKDIENQELRKELKITRKIASDVSFKADFKQKELDKYQTKLDDFSV